MHRTGYARLGRQFGRFLWENYRLLIFLALFLIGAVNGCTVFAGLSPEKRTLLSGILRLSEVPSAVGPFLSAVLSSALLLLLLLAVLFLSGLSACGIPGIASVPLLYGLATGMTEGCCHAAGGWLATAVLVVPPAMVGAWTLLMACAESTRMTLRLGGQLLPSQKLCGNLWEEFRLYLFRFSVFLLLAFGAALLGVILRCLWF